MYLPISLLFLLYKIQCFCDTTVNLDCILFDMFENIKINNAQSF